MNKINWGVRFNKKNIQFILRFAFALASPVLVYFGITVEDLTTWGMVGQLFLDAISNPFVVGFSVANALNMVPDPVTKGLGDSSNALTYKVPH